MRNGRILQISLFLISFLRRWATLKYAGLALFSNQEAVDNAFFLDCLLCRWMFEGGYFSTLNLLDPLGLAERKIRLVKDIALHRLDMSVCRPAMANNVFS